MMKETSCDETLEFTAVKNGNPAGRTNDDHNRSEHQREHWSSRLDYILTMVGYCVSYGNLWRFPYVCNRNGGGAFLIPYMIFLVILAFPMFYLESCLGQFSGKGAVQMWSFCPLFKGVGIGTIITVILGLPFWNLYLAWPIYYLVKTFSYVLPWTTCGNSWNTELCVEDIYNDNKTQIINNTVVKESILNVNVSIADSWENKMLSHSAAEEFYQYHVLDVSRGLHEIGFIQWHIVASLFASHVIIFLCLFRGIKTTGKIVYVTALLPYLLLLVIFIRMIILPGAVDGILYYIKPDFTKLQDAQVWLEACLQVFISLGPGWGMLATSASYRRFHEPLFGNCVLLCAISEGTSFLSGFVTFAILGVMTENIGVAISEVVSSGPGLAFVAYSQALAQLPLPQLWSFLFFLMLITVALDSQFLYLEIFSTALIDQYPKTLRQRRSLVTAAICGFAFLPGIVVCTQGGAYIYQLLDWYLVALSLFLYCALECIASVWIYGVKQLSDDVEMMFGKPLPVVIKILWGLVTPITLITVCCVSLLKYQPPTYGTYVYPAYTSVIGWIIAVIPVLPIPIYMIHVIRNQNAPSFKKKLLLSLQSDSKWIPNMPASSATYRNEVARNRRTFKQNLVYLFKS